MLVPESSPGAREDTDETIQVVYRSAFPTWKALQSGDHGDFIVLLDISFLLHSRSTTTREFCMESSKYFSHVSHIICTGSK